MKQPLTGVLPVLPTPFHDDGAVDEDGMRRVLDGEKAVTLLADLDAGCTGTMTSALQPERIRPIVTGYRAGDADAAPAHWRDGLPLINHENRQCGQRAAQAVMKEGGVIGSDHVRHPGGPRIPGHLPWRRPGNRRPSSTFRREQRPRRASS